VRRLLLLAFAAASFAATAEARDPPADFAGAHVGLVTGYGFGASGDWCFCSFLPSAADAVEGEGGIVVGAEAGYGLRFGALVVEAAARAQHADIKFSEVCGTTPCSGETGWLLEAQLTAGIVLFDDLLLAGTAGLAAADTYASTGAAEASSALHDGTVLGLRIEQGMSENWRMGLEYRHYDMHGTNDTPAGEAAIDWTTETIALVINYELGE
jgi:opacity protein-like surface antigen